MILLSIVTATLSFQEQKIGAECIKQIKTTGRSIRYPNLAE